MMDKVVLEHPHSVRIVRAQSGEPEHGEALVRLRMAGICGSDLSAYRGTSPLVTYPRVLGHELLVDVVSSPDRPQLEGGRAVVDPMFSCGYCVACRKGAPNCCVSLRVMGVHIDGGLQEERTIDARHLVPVPADMPDELAVLAEPLTIAYHAVRRSGINAGGTAVVLGAGAIGLLVTRLLIGARGCRVLIVDIDPERLRLARSFGAVPLQGDEASLTGAVAEATGGDMADVVIEASGNARATAMTTALVGHAGRIVLVGWNQGPVPIDTVTLMRKEAILMGSRNSFNAFPAVLQLLAGGIVDAGALITHLFDLGSAAEALEVLDGGREAVLKVLITAS
jgi:2-desacetyl-2-hydroxyethyl bacteriochlorophyllide A dehydrogenase